MTGRLAPSAGFTLVELVVVLALLTILFGLAALEFNRYQRKGSIESQITTLKADLLSVRSQALFEKRGRAVVFTPTSFAVYSSELASGTPLQQRTLANRLALRINPYRVVFNASGLSDSADLETICIEPADNPGAVDSLVLQAARIETGKRNAQASCSAANIQIR